METTRTDKTLRNARFALAAQVIALLANFAARKVFVLFLSEEYLGLSGLFSNILSVLSLTELGVGAAITFSLYKPLAQGDTRQVTALMQLFRRAYAWIGCAVLLLGAAATPFLPYLIKEMPAIPELRLIYLLYVVSSAASYFFAYKQTLIIADQKRYLTNIYLCLANLAQHLLQIAVLFLMRSYIAYLLVYIFSTVLVNVLLSRKADRMYPYLRAREKIELPQEERRAIGKNIRAIMAHKVGGVVVNGTDNILLSRMVGLGAVGLYSNYLLIISALNGLYGVLFNSVTASIGHLGATETPQRRREVFLRLDFFGAWLYGFSAACLAALFNPFIRLWLQDARWCFPFSTVLLIAANFYFTGMRRAVQTFREGLGIYRPDRYKPLIEAAVNLAVSIYLGRTMGVDGILIGTLVSTLSTCVWVEPYILYKHGFAARVWPYFRRYLAFTAVAAVSTALCCFVCGRLPLCGFAGFCARAALCALLPNLLYFLCFRRSADFRFFLGLVKGRLGWQKH